MTQHSAAHDLRAVADLLDVVDQLDTDAGRHRLPASFYTYTASGTGAHLVTGAALPDWHDRAAAIMGELGGTWERRTLDMTWCLTSYAHQRDRWVDAGTVHVYVPRWAHRDTDWPATDLKGLPGLVTP